MPYNHPESGDPLVLNGVAFETSPETALEAAYVFAEELARLGHSEQAILCLFKSPEYQGPYSAFQVLGADTVSRAVRECCETMSACRAVIRARHGAGPSVEKTTPL
ncbi:MAG: hypothetical protein AMXMBFR84_43130 [Candidatus Hydrogenedentota bacterium]